MVPLILPGLVIPWLSQFPVHENLTHFTKNTQPLHRQLSLITFPVSSPVYHSSFPLKFVSGKLFCSWYLLRFDRYLFCKIVSHRTRG